VIIPDKEVLRQSSEDTTREIASAFAGEKVSRRRDSRWSIGLLVAPVLALGLALLFSGRTVSGVVVLCTVPLTWVVTAFARPMEQVFRSHSKDE
jgi:hypothetical protein